MEAIYFFNDSILSKTNYDLSVSCLSLGERSHFLGGTKTSPLSGVATANHAHVPEAGEATAALHVRTFVGPGPVIDAPSAGCGA